MICQDQQRLTRGQRDTSASLSVTNHFRILVQVAETESWRIYASFRFPGEAEACLDVLRRRGIEARLDSTDLSPIAF